ncbi:MAG TPA: TraB family protein, partial [Chromatiales bacterium]|nr:TraB family protein [Chromatiales bacterium]
MSEPESEAPGETRSARDSSDVVVVRSGEREFLLVGTAHVSRESADLARQVIASEDPDAVCVELDERRYEALRSEQKFESLDVREVLRRKQLSTLIFNLILASYQRQLGMQLGVQPGAELLAAARVAEEHGAPVVLCDRDVRATLRRAWSSLTLWRKFQLIGAMLASLFDSPEISEEDLRELRQQDVLTKLMDEIGEEFPSLKRVLIDERDLYLAEKIRSTSGRRIVAVLGAGHLQGVRRTLESGEKVDIAALDELPPSSAVLKWVGWGVPAVILGAIAAIGVRQG